MGLLSSKLIPGISALVAVVSIGCSAGASLPSDHITPTAVINSERVSVSLFEETWGQIVRWQLEDADWTIELPESGRWSSVDPFNESGYSPDSALFTTSPASIGEVAASMRLELHRHEKSSLARPFCDAPTVFDSDGSLVSRELPPLAIQGETASVYRITAAAADGIHTGTLQVCFITVDSVFVVSVAGRPATVLPDLLQFVQTLELN